MQHVRGISSVHVPEAPVDDDRKSLTADAIKVGQAVYVTSLRSLGTVLSINGNRVNVDINGLTATVRLVNYNQLHVKKAIN